MAQLTRAKYQEIMKIMVYTKENPKETTPSTNRTRDAGKKEG